MIVLDASVILKWFFLAEPARDEAIRIREKHVDGKDIIAAPDLLPYEIANSLATKSTISEQDAQKGIIEILSYALEFHRLEAEDYVKTIRLAREHRLSVYDAAYVHLAQKLNCDFITADGKLHEKTKSLPFVRLL